MENPDPSSRDFDSISPSAYALLLMKGLTPIPYAHQASELLSSISPSLPASSDAQPHLLDPANRNPGFWARVLHFESRYYSVDQLLSDLPATNILELSSGFSFRGLALSRQRPVYYIDTDLPDVIATKQRFIESLTAPADSGSPQPAGPSPSAQPAASTPATPGHYELQPLNVLDTPAFKAIVDRFPPGELTIVNEGLLVYLDTSEKEQLCRIIRDILLRRGGCWITGDIYLRSSNPNIFGDKNDAFVKFLEQHNIEENKFTSFDDATAFFARMGFTVEREAELDYGTLSSLPHLLATCTPQQLERLRDLGRTRIHAVWRLRPA